MNIGESKNTLKPVERKMLDSRSLNRFNKRKPNMVIVG